MQSCSRLYKATYYYLCQTVSLGTLNLFNCFKGSLKKRKKSFKVFFPTLCIFININTLVSQSKYCQLLNKSVKINAVYKIKKTKIEKKKFFSRIWLNIAMNAIKVQQQDKKRHTKVGQHDCGRTRVLKTNVIQTHIGLQAGL